jgi:hypothetical protein
MTPDPDPLSHLNDLIHQYTILSSIPDMARYRRITGPKAGNCLFRGCTEPVVWEDTRGEHFLCEGHYRIMVKWITEAQKALISGRSSSLFREPG